MVNTTNTGEQPQDQPEPEDLHGLTEKQLELLNASARLEQVNLFDRDDFGVTAWLWTQFCLPYKNPGDLARWERTRGSVSLTITPARLVDHAGEVTYGFPYGMYARQVLLYLTTQAKKTGSRQIEVGSSFNDFLRRLGITGRGGRINRLVEDQLLRVLLSGMHISDNRQIGEDRRLTGELFSVAKSYELWLRNPKDERQGVLFGSHVTLSEAFFNSVMNNPVPVDLGAIRALSGLGGAAMRIDIFMWLCYRIHPTVLKGKAKKVTWTELKTQFGAEYKLMKHFKADFLKHLSAVRVIYAKAQIAFIEDGLLLKPSKAYVPALKELPER